MRCQHTVLLSLLTGCSLLVTPHERNRYDLVDGGQTTPRDSGRDASDAAPDAAPVRLAAPVLRFPWNGFMTGSVHTGELDPPRNALRPRFVWEPVEEADHYEIALDWRCEAGTRDRCAFTSAAVDVTATSDWRPASVLDVSMTPPVGRRYYWRVRACRSTDCSPWSEVRYLDVGRQPGDLNGDGYADVATVGVDLVGDHRVHVHLGPDFATVRTFEATGGLQYRWLTLGGDVDADGFPDLVVVEDGSDPPTICVMTNGLRDACGPANRPTLPVGGFAPDRGAGGGDVDGDGFADLLLAVRQRDRPNHVELLLGASAPWMASHGATLVSTGLVAGFRDLFGQRLSLAGDHDGDGFADIVVGSPLENGASVEASGRVYLYTGGEAVSTDPSVRLTSAMPEQTGAFGLPSVAGDVNADGFADVLTLAFGEAAGAGRIYVRHGARALVDDVELVMPNPVSSAFARNDLPRVGLATGDVDGDGYADLIVGVAAAPDSPGALFVLRGDSSGLRGTPVNADGVATLRSAVVVGDTDGAGRATVIASLDGRLVALRFEAGSLVVAGEMTSPDPTAREYGTALAGLQ